MHRFLGFPRPPHGRTHRFLAVGMTVTCRLHEAELRPSTSLRHGGAGRRRAFRLCTSSPRPRPTWPPCEMPWRRRTRRWHGGSRQRPTWSTVKCECCAGAPRWGVLGSLGGMSVCVIVHFLEVSVQVLWVYAPFLIQNPKKRTGGFLMSRLLNARN